MQLKRRARGFVVAVKVVPGSSRNRVAGAYGDGIRVTVTAPPAGGAANAAVVELLAAALGVAPENVQIVNGLSSQRKEVLISGVAAEAIKRRLK